MSELQQSKAWDNTPSGLLELAEGEALTLATPVPALLRVTAGRVWLTETVSATGAARMTGTDRDLVLEAGDEVPLPLRCAVVVEGWPRARLEHQFEARAATRGAPARTARTEVRGRRAAAACGA